MTELFSIIPQIRKDLIIFNLSQIKKESPSKTIKNALNYIKTLNSEEQEFAKFYLDLVFVKLKELNDENNSN